MPRMKKAAQQTEKRQFVYGYFLYPDGKSYWGINLNKGGHIGMEITKEQHGLSQDEKVSLYVAPEKAKVSA